MRFLRPNPAWNLRKSLKLMFAAIVLHLCVTGFLTNIHKDELHTQQLSFNVDLKVCLKVALTLFLIH